MAAIFEDEYSKLSIILCMPVGRIFSRKDISKILEEVIDIAHVVGIAQLQHPAEWCIVFDHVDPLQKILTAGFISALDGSCIRVKRMYSREISGKILWLPPQLPTAKTMEALCDFGKVYSVSRDTELLDGRCLVTGPRSFFLEPSKGITVEDLPHIMEIDGNRALLIVRGRKPMCTFCNLIGHISRECEERRNMQTKKRNISQKKKKKKNGKSAKEFPQPTAAMTTSNVGITSSPSPAAGITNSPSSFTGITKTPSPPTQVLPIDDSTTLELQSHSSCSSTCSSSPGVSPIPDVPEDLELSNLTTTGILGKTVISGDTITYYHSKLLVDTETRMGRKFDSNELEVLFSKPHLLQLAEESANFDNPKARNLRIQLLKDAGLSTKKTGQLSRELDNITFMKGYYKSANIDVDRINWFFDGIPASAKAKALKKMIFAAVAKFEEIKRLP